MNHKRAAHRLVTLGDSLTQGFLNGAIHRTDCNYPSFLSHALGCASSFKQPKFLNQGGLPLNFEALLRGMESEFGEHISWNDALGMSSYMVSTLRRIKSYWESPQSQSPVQQLSELPWNNQSIWSIGLGEALYLTPEKVSTWMHSEENRPPWFSVLPHNAFGTTALRVLAPQGNSSTSKTTMLDNIQELATNGGIENLLVFLGSNNILGAVTKLYVQLSEDEDLERFSFERQCTVYRPEHFRQLYDRLAKRILSMTEVNRVFIATLPYVSHAPGLKSMDQNRGYSSYYSRFWIDESEFDPDYHPHLTNEEVQFLDQTIDEYNDIITECAQRNGWTLVPIHEMFNALVDQPTTFNYPKELLHELRKYPSLKHYVDSKGLPKFTAEYLHTEPSTSFEGNRLDRGGLFSLDGLHPTVIGYGLIGWTFYQTMEKEGVSFKNPYPWKRIVENDELLTQPPAYLSRLPLLLTLMTFDVHATFSKRSKHLFSQFFDNFLNQ